MLCVKKHASRIIWTSNQKPFTAAVGKCPSPRCLSKLPPSIITKAALNNTHGTDHKFHHQKLITHTLYILVDSILDEENTQKNKIQTWRNHSFHNSTTDGGLLSRLNPSLIKVDEIVPLNPIQVTTSAGPEAEASSVPARAEEHGEITNNQWGLINATKLQRRLHIYNYVSLYI